MKHLLLATIAVFAGVMPAMAQEKSNKVTVDFQLRTRGEYRNGQGGLHSEDVRPGTFINDRARLGIAWENNGLSAKLSAQQTGTWGNGAQQTDSKKGLNVNEAWAKMKFGADGAGFIQLGRQALSYDDQRLLGGLDWAVTGRSFDAVKVGFENKTNALHAIFSYNQDSEHKAGETTSSGNHYSGVAGPQHMEALWYHINAAPSFGASLLFMNTGIQADKADADGNITEHRTNNMQTFGTYINGKAKAFAYDFSAYYQMGKKTKDTNISAFMVSANAKYKINEAFTVGVGDDYLSGSDGTGDKYKTFNNLYGTHHKFYGTMDILNTTPTQGLNDLNANVAYKASKKVDMTLAYHYFAAPNAIKVADGDQKTLGSEVDLQLNWKIRQFVTLQAGYSVFFATQAMQNIKGGNKNCWQDWGWVSLNINPTVFTAIF